MKRCAGPEELVRVLEELGTDIAQETDRQMEIDARNGVYHDLAAEHPEVCRLVSRSSERSSAKT